MYLPIQDFKKSSCNEDLLHVQILKSENIEFVVAPYEADAQLAYLSNLEDEKNEIVAVISEDSDLLAYGCSSVRKSQILWYGMVEVTALLTT